jgi:succinyl-CoA synthetase beta subunit
VNIHEYQAKEIFRKYGIPIPPGEVATTPEEAEAIARKFGTIVVVKAQVHAGGRGKAGGVKLAKTPAEAKAIAAQILKLTIKGLPVQKVLVTPAADIASEAYVGIIVDRASKRAVFMASPAGGIDIEEVAAKTPDKILRRGVDPRYGLQLYEAMELAFFLYSDMKQVRAAAKILQQLYKAFSENGGSLAEINPLVTTPAGDVVALDAKMVIDDNELDRRPDIAALRDESAEDPAEVEARKASLTFIKLDGNVGCVVNGAGRIANVDALDLEAGKVAHDGFRIATDDYLRSKSNPSVHVCGDVLSGPPQLSPIANYEGRIVGRNIVEGPRHKPDYASIPSCVYTVPALATVGLSKAKAKEKGLKTKVQVNDMEYWFSTRTFAETLAWSKIIVEEGTDHIIGAHFVGHAGEELINVFGLAMKHGITASQMRDFVFAYPTFSADIKSML